MIKVFTLWVIMWLVTYPALLADNQHVSKDKQFNQEHCRKNLGFATLMALLPPMWATAPFLTGFYENGFQFTCKGNSHE